MRLIRTVTAVLLTAGALMAAQPAADYTLAGKDAPTIEARNLDNGLEFEQYKGKPVILNFFGKNCRYCLKEMPHFVKMKEKYGDKFEIVSVHVQPTMSATERANLEKKYGINYPLYEYSDNVQFVRDIGARAGWSGAIPFNILFGKDGEVLQVIPGYIDETTLDQMLDTAMKRK